MTEEEIRPSLEKRLEAIISGAALLADSSCTRDFHRERIIAECNAIRQALQDLLSEYMNNVGNLFSTNPMHQVYAEVLSVYKCDKLQMSTWFCIDWLSEWVLLTEYSIDIGISRDGIQQYVIVLFEAVSKY